MTGRMPGWFCRHLTEPKTVVEDDTVKQGINPNTAVFQGDKLDFVSNGDTVDFVQVSLTDGSVTTAALPQDLAYSLNSSRQSATSLFT